MHASHRDAPGVVEVHTRVTDTIYVLEGSATFVTGGRLLDGATIAPSTSRASVREIDQRQGAASSSSNLTQKRWVLDT